MTKQEAIDFIKKHKPLEHLKRFEDEVMDTIDDTMADYLDDDWEDEFDDIHEAYEEQGRGQAESYAVQGLIEREYPDISTRELVDLMDDLADAWGISYG